MSAFEIIETCLTKVSGQGIRVVRGAALNWCGPDPDVPIECNALGAVLWVHGKARTPSAWTTLGEILDEPHFWFYRWTIGWDNLHQLVYYTEGKDKKLTAHLDEVCQTAKALSKKWTTSPTRSLEECPK